MTYSDVLASAIVATKLNVVFAALRNVRRVVANAGLWCGSLWSMASCGENAGSRGHVISRVRLVPSSRSAEAPPTIKTSTSSSSTDRSILYRSPSAYFLHTDQSQHLNMPAFWTIGTLFGASSVMLGAFGAHGLKQRIADPARIANWGTAAQYQVCHLNVLA